MSWQVLERQVMAGGHGRVLRSKFSSGDHSSQGDPFSLASRFKVVEKLAKFCWFEAPVSRFILASNIGLNDCANIV